MLQALCGNKNVQKILLFLFVNGKCYGTQLHRQLKSPLTPIQKALLRLEKGGIITSYYEGKTRLYRFNAAYPLIHELEQLLKKAYTLLHPQEKKLYAVFHSEKINENKQALFTCWERLSKVHLLTFNAKTNSKDDSGWNGKGKGEVSITREGDSVIVFSEKGTWQSKDSRQIDFSNVFRWSIDRHAGIISLEHLRRGPNNPVFLFHLVPSTMNSLTSADSHFCEGDVYFGKLFIDTHSLRLNWRVIGPKKNEEIDYYYN